VGLAAGTVVGGPATLNGFEDGLAAAGAGGVFAAIHRELQLKISGMTADAEKIGDGGTAGINGQLQYAAALLNDSPPFLLGQEMCWLLRCNPGGEENFIGIDVADTGNETAVHQQRLHGDPPAASQGEQVVGDESWSEGFEALLAGKIRLQLRGVVRRPNHDRAESAAVVEADIQAIVQVQHQVIVFMERRLPLDQAELAGHAQMYHQHRAVDHSQQQVFGASIDGPDLLAGNVFL